LPCGSQVGIYFPIPFSIFPKFSGETDMSKTILITGASSGFGRMAAEALARAGHIVYASMRDTAGRNAVQVEQIATFSKQNHVDLRTVELDVQSQASVDAAVAKVIADAGRIDVLIHNAGHMASGPAEAFTAEQFAHLYDVNVLSAQRVNRAALPHLRQQQQGLLVWVSSSSSAGGTPPYLAPYFAAKAAMDSMAVQYARELSRWGIETSIIVPGAFTGGTNHFSHAGKPADESRVAEYETGPYADFASQIEKAFGAIVPPDADASSVATAIVEVVDAPFGKRPFRVHIDPSQDGADVGFAVLDRLRAEMLNRVGLSDLLKPRVLSLE
jgi:NAD(P)-dependent dehydrogenase (short-subunit alcohol dehydrogenase family)